MEIVRNSCNVLRIMDTIIFNEHEIISHKE